MEITLVQTNIEWANPKVNASHIEAAILATPKSNLYVLPEMWSTGFAIQPEDIAESENSNSLHWMQKMANRLDAAIAGSIVIKSDEDGSYRNRLYFVKPQKCTSYVIQCTYYDKHHLFTYGGEHLHYTQGKDRIVVEWRGVRFLLLICYDLRFPIWSRNNEDYDCILYVASWPKQRIAVWNSLLIARAIENQCYVAGVNRVGKDPNCQYCGGTQLIDPYGHITEQAETDKEMTLTGTIDMEALNAFRNKFPVLKDRD